MAEAPHTVTPTGPHARRAGLRTRTRAGTRRRLLAVVVTAATTAALALPAALAGPPGAQAATAGPADQAQRTARPAATATPTPTPNATTAAAVPHYDHIVVVIDENHSQTAVVGNPSAPWITTLSMQNANLTQSYAETHPSEPNYLALFSGSTQGLTDDSCPHTYTAPDIASTLIAAGRTFTGYSESMPSAGYTGCGSGTYARKHNPWSDFPAVPAASNQPFSAFPSDYSTLPSLSVVVPNLQDDMHDGTIAQGDSWLSTNMANYVAWAKTHNSLFVLTFDEDDYTSANRIPTIIAGAQVTQGTYTENVNHYNVLRTIADSFGVTAPGNAATANPITDVFAAPSGDQPPTAAFTSSCTQLACTFDGSGSSDPDGSVASWSWDFGDGSTGTGPTPSHSYLASGSYPVTLTVADDQGAAGTVSHTVTVASGTGSVLASDSFNRTVANGWGSADTGGAYRLQGASAGYSVAPGAGRMALGVAGQTNQVALPSVASTDTDLTTTLSLDRLPAVGPVYLNVIGRQVSANNEYDGKVVVNADGSVTIRVIKIVSGVETALNGPVVVAGLTYTPGLQLSVRTVVTGVSPTTVQARVWVTGTAQPGSWQVSATDTTAALQTKGAVGVNAYLSSRATNAPVTVAVSSLSASTTAGATNQAPSAAFTSSCTQLSCSFDGRGSSDLDGTVTSYAWDFGDGSTGTGATPSHAYVTAGAYTVRLVVTDNAGAAGAVSHTVVASSPPPPSPPVAAFTASCSQLSCSFDAGATTSPSGETITAYAWDFGDGTAGSGVTPTHAYAVAASYTVRLTVTDDDGATGSVTHQISVAPAGPVAFAADGFARTVGSGWGNADTGGAWTVVGGVSAFSVAPGAGQLTVPKAGATLTAYLPSVPRTDADVVVGLSLAAVPTGGPVYVNILGRRVSAGNEYDAKVVLNPDGSVTIRVIRVLGGTETAIGGPVVVTGLKYAPTSVLDVRLQVAGTVAATGGTTVRARAWSASATEPTSWQASATDTSTALQSAGAVGVGVYLSSTATNAPFRVSVNSFAARPTGG